LALLDSKFRVFVQPVHHKERAVQVNIQFGNSIRTRFFYVVVAGVILGERWFWCRTSCVRMPVPKFVLEVTVALDFSLACEGHMLRIREASFLRLDPTWKMGIWERTCLMIFLFFWECAFFFSFLARAVKL